MSEQRISIEHLLAGLNGRVGNTELTVTGLSLDSRLIRPGDAFVALAGENGHGLDHLSEAVDAGAVAVVHDGALPVADDAGVESIAVPDLARHLPLLAGRMWPAPLRDMDLLAVTGTNGKTSVAWLLAQALGGAMIGTLGAGRPGELTPGTHTTPDIFSVYRTLSEFHHQGIATVVMEASSHALAQQRLAGLAFSCVIFTTLGHDHLDYHADKAAYGEAKARLFTDFESRRQIVNLDDAFGAEIAERRAGSGGLIGYSLNDQPRACAMARLLEAGPKGIAAEIRLNEDRFEVHSDLIGRINLWNVLIVAAELGARKKRPADIQRIIAGLAPVPGRMQPIKGRTGRLAVIDYAHTPEALENALGSARELASQELWCVFGCGGDRDRAKRPRMGRIAELMADHVVLTDDNPRHEDATTIIREIQAGMERPQRTRVMRDRAAAIRYAISSCTASDVVLVAGKGHETEQVIGDQRLVFDDASVAREALEVAA